MTAPFHCFGLVLLCGAGAGKLGKRLRLSAARKQTRLQHALTPFEGLEDLVDLGANAFGRAAPITGY